MLGAAATVLSFLAGCVETADSDGWTRFRSTAHKFSAKFPGPVRTEEDGDKAQFDAGTDVHLRIACSKVPRLRNRELELADLRRMRNEMTESLKAAVKDEKDVEFHGLPATEFVLTLGSDGLEVETHNRFVRVGDRFYQQIVTVPAGTDAQWEVRKFFDSFEVQRD